MGDRVECHWCGSQMATIQWHAAFSPGEGFGLVGPETKRGNVTPLPGYSYRLYGAASDSVTSRGHEDWRHGNEAARNERFSGNDEESDGYKTYRCHKCSTWQKVPNAVDETGRMTW